MNNEQQRVECILVSGITLSAGDMCKHLQRVVDGWNEAGWKVQSMTWGSAGRVFFVLNKIPEDVNPEGWDW